MARLILAALVSLALPGVAYSHEYRFNGADVLNLSAPERLVQTAKAAQTPGDALAADQAQKILAAANLNADAPGQIPYAGEYDDRLRAQERLSIAKEGGAVQRSKKQLSIKPAAGGIVSFHDWTQAGAAGGDGDSETFVYRGRTGALRYHLVEVLFGQDSPGAFLVNPASGKLAFVHNGSDVAALSRDGRKILAFDPLNAPYLLAIAALDADGPTLELQCRVSENGKVAAGAFKGWSENNSFGVVYSLAPGGGATAQDIAVGFNGGEHGWTWASPDAALFGKSAGYACGR